MEEVEAFCFRIKNAQIDKYYVENFRAYWI